MSESNTEKKRFSARVRTNTLDEIEEYAEERGLNRSQAIEHIVREWSEQGEVEPRPSAVDPAPVSELARRLFTLGAWSLLAAVAVWVVIAVGALRPSVVLLFALSALTGGALLFVLVGVVVAAFVNYLPDGDQEPADRSLFDPRRWVA